MIVKLKRRFTSNLLSIEEYVSGVSAHTNLGWVVPYQKQPGCSVDRY